MSSVLLTILVAGAGIFAILLGLVHVAMPAILRFPEAIGTDDDRPSLGEIRLSGLRYQLLRSDLRGITWVMSNAASYVLLTIGLVDIAWAVGWRDVPLGIGATWIAGWWAIRAGGQLLLGVRAYDIAIATWFGCLAVIHLLIASIGS